MASSNKTTRLQLNQWSGGDKPKRVDFNQDNTILDNLLGGHILNAALHVIQADKEKWNEPYTVGTYVGTDASERNITLPFAPKVVLLMCSNQPLMGYTNTDNKMMIYSGLAVEGYNSIGVVIGGNGFKVSQSSAASNGNCYLTLNKAGYRYHYIAFR